MVRPKPPKVLMIGPALSVKGGITTVLETYLGAWDYKAYQLKRLGIYVDGSKWLKLWVALVAGLRHLVLLAFWRPDIVHVHFSEKAGFYRESLFIITAKLLSRVTVAHGHAADFQQFFERQPALLQRYIRFALNLPDILFVLSTQWQTYFQGLGIEPRTEVLHNPAPDVPGIDHRTAALPPIILTLGRLGQRKGTYDILAAVPHVLARFPDTQFWLGGDGDIDEIAQQLAQQAWGTQVRLLGWVRSEEKHNVLSQATIFLLPSYHEGLPMAVLEAMAYALPVVTTPVGGIPDVIADNVTGLFVMPGDSEAIAEALITLLSHPARAAELGTRAQAFVAAHASTEAIMQHLYAWYLTLLSHGNEVSG